MSLVPDVLRKALQTLTPAEAKVVREWIEANERKALSAINAVVTVISMRERK